VLVRRPLDNPEEALICDVKGAVLCRAEANYFRELPDLSATIERRRRSARMNLELVKGLSTGMVTPPEGMQSILAISRASTIEALNDDSDEPLALAAGAEDDAIGRTKAKAAGSATIDQDKANAFLDFLGKEY
jgi:hypothetical protein